ncbi:MAG: DUF2058 domain-containing protein [Gammaproteobacteria bacterium]|jgi:hypothetical protein|nr:DUF2058 domain-containing protein [Gammaproteobacteria bacterium]
MGNSLQDQLLKVGLIDEHQARDARKAKGKKDRKNRNKKAPAPDANAERIRKAQAEKAKRDRELNEQRAAREERKARAAQIAQLIEQNRMSRDDGDLPHQFVDGKKIRKIFVREAMRRDLLRGRLAVVKHRGRYEVVPADIAEKIRERDAASVMSTGHSGSDDDVGESYADYKVPDDLMW